MENKNGIIVGTHQKYPNENKLNVVQSKGNRARLSFVFVVVYIRLLLAF